MVHQWTTIYTSTTEVHGPSQHASLWLSVPLSKRLRSVNKRAFVRHTELGGSTHSAQQLEMQRALSVACPPGGQPPVTFERSKHDVGVGSRSPSVGPFPRALNRRQRRRVKGKGHVSEGAVVAFPFEGRGQMGTVANCTDTVGHDGDTHSNWGPPHDNKIVGVSELPAVTLSYCHVTLRPYV